MSAAKQVRPRRSVRKTQTMPSTMPEKSEQGLGVTSSRLYIRKPLSRVAIDYVSVKAKNRKPFEEDGELPKSVDPPLPPPLKESRKSGGKPKPSPPPPREVTPKSPPRGPATPKKTSVSPHTQPSPADPPNPTKSENPTRAASQTVGKNVAPEKVAQGGPPNSADVATAKDPNLSQVTEPEPNQDETAVESGKRPEGSPAKSLPDESTQDPFDESDIESLYASPSPEKMNVELDPIELESDPDFEMMERMLLSHRGPSSQPLSIKKESTAQSPALFGTKRPLKRQRSLPSLIGSSQVPTQTLQAELGQAKRPRVNGPHSSVPAMVLNDRKKHPEFWDLDGTVVLQVDDVLFRVMRSALSKASPWFQRLFSEEPDHLEIMAGCPVYMIEEDFSHLDFVNLLRGLENGLEYALNPPHYLRIASIFRTASLLEFNTLRRWSLGCLEKQWPAALPPPSKPSKFGSKIPWAEETLTIADRLDAQILIKRVYWELCTRSEFGRIDSEVYDNEVEEIMPTRSRLSRSVLMDLTRIRERLLPEWTRITRYPPIGVPCARTTKTLSSSVFAPPTTQPTPCSLDYANWFKVIQEVEVDDMTIDDRRTDPISALEVMIVETDWEKEGGFCPDCVKTWKAIWTKDREKIWKNLGDWLGLDVDAES